MNEPWVVTYKVEHSEGIGIREVFRGPKEECQRISRHFGGGEDDRMKPSRSNKWSVIIGPAEEWDQFLTEN